MYKIQISMNGFIEIQMYFVQNKVPVDTKKGSP